MPIETTPPGDPTSETVTSPAPGAVAPAGEPDHKIRMEALVENLPKWRDAMLVLAGLAYVLGYLSWAIYAAEQGAGLAPVLDAQYFSAGILPAVLVIASCFVAWWLRCLGRWMRKPVSNAGKTTKRVLEVVGTLFIFTGFFLLLLLKYVPGKHPAYETVYIILLAAGMVTVIVSSFFSREKSDVWYHRFLMGLAWIYLPLVGFTAFSLYTTKVFPKLPQAFGGPRPQCVQLDMQISKVSSDTLRLLAPEWSSGQGNRSDIVRSRNLYLIFQNSEYLFLQTSRPASPATNQMFRLKSSSVESIFPMPEAVAGK